MNTNNVGVVILAIFLLGLFGSVFFVLYKTVWTAFFWAFSFIGLILFAIISMYSAPDATIFSPTTLGMIAGISCLSWCISFGIKSGYSWCKKILKINRKNKLQI